jgi:hypothetical protein
MSDTPLLPDDFFEQVRSTNPFDVNRVVPSTTAAADADAVHARPFGQLLELASQARQQPTGVGALVWGEAGIGKSHLLARLGRWAGPEHKHALFVYLANLQAAPEQLPRSVLRCVVAVLTRGRESRLYDTPLYRLVNATLRHALQYDGSRTPTWREVEDAYRDLLDDLAGRTVAGAAVVDRPAYAVLYRFFRSAYQAREGNDDGLAALAVRWLAGDALDPEEAHALGLPAGRRSDALAAADDEEVKRILVALAELARYRRQPLILCFDQVDNLEPQQFAALARFLHALLDSAANVLVITAGLQDTLRRWLLDGMVQESTWHRLAQYELMLQRVSVPEAEQIVRARLHAFTEPFRTVPAVDELVRRDPLFPLGEAWFRERLADRVEVRPRDVINWAREGWRQEQDLLEQAGGEAWLEGWGTRRPTAPRPLPAATAIETLIDEKIALRLQEHQERRQLEPHTLPPDGENLAGLVEATLRGWLHACGRAAHARVERLARPRRGPRPPYDLLLRRKDGPGSADVRTGVLCLVETNRVTMAASLRRLVQDPEPPDHLVLVTDARRPLDPGAVGRDHLAEVRRRPGRTFAHVELTPDQYAALDALQAVVGEARSGDLEIDLPGGGSRRVSEREVIDSYQRRQRYLGHPLLRVLLHDERASIHPPAEQVLVNR